MAYLNTYDITTALSGLVQKQFDPVEFPYDILRIYRNTSNTTITKLKAGDTNPAYATGGVMLKKYLYFKSCGKNEDPAVVGQDLLADPLTKRNQPRFVLATNGIDVYAYDTKTGETENHKFSEEEYWSHFLLPLAPGHDRAPKIEEHPADVKAAKLLGRLYDAILKANPTWTAGNHIDALNHLMTRLLFCFYAEDTGIFATKKIFIETIERYTQEDGSDLGPLLDRLFAIMNVEEKRLPAKLSPIEAAFPYVNGSLFGPKFPVPVFDRFARRQLLDCGNLDWTDINPDIFGSMVQTISDPNERANTGMHYTSVPNIMKVLNPLFLDNLKTDYDKAEKSVAKLQALMDRIANIRVLDPACGSGNFLILAYRELRLLETQVMLHIKHLTGKAPLSFVGVSITNFYGIEIAPFACETTRLSLWIAEHKANQELQKLLNISRPTLPLPKISTIYCANALRANWITICPETDNAETYVCGNPPYQGSKEQTDEQKSDIDYVFANYSTTYRRIDYIGCWFVKAAEYLALVPATRAAFVSTNSICQGEHVGILWPIMSALHARIAFAHTSFIWKNNASHNAGVTCIIVGITAGDTREIKLYTGNRVRTVQTIGPYLIADSNVIVSKEHEPISDLPALTTGCEPGDGGHLVLTTDERNKLLAAYPASQPLIRPYLGSRDFLNGGERWCLWVTDGDRRKAETFPPIHDRIARVASKRSGSPWVTTPYKFGRDTNMDEPALVIPKVSSEHRQFLQIGMVSGTTITNNTLRMVYNPPQFLLAVLSSRMHYVWAQTVGGRMRTDMQYSTTIVYNAFPFPCLSAEQKRFLTNHSKAILKARAKHPGKTIAWLYNRETMPDNLLQAHRDSDAYIEEYVFGRKYKDDTHRLEHLFSMYANIKARADNPLLTETPPAPKKAA